MKGARFVEDFSGNQSDLSDLTLESRPHLSGTGQAEEQRDVGPNTRGFGGSAGDRGLFRILAKEFGTRLPDGLRPE